ncbi:hypothetical protein PILCRDRAFT_501775 [Piloderma croceum F 1598]|uniref:Uncharacterized protein n=1 Tax=Piloderma croceum (strain F 1598) TaxID=765440 RepID=A0A0C3FNU4_PILCF|nr:hypothetical protein PILCRDRAFT_501775 [Piloderma croceum F 1598]
MSFKSCTRVVQPTFSESTSRTLTVLICNRSRDASAEMDNILPAKLQLNDFHLNFLILDNDFINDICSLSINTFHRLIVPHIQLAALIIVRNLSSSTIDGRIALLIFVFIGVINVFLLLFPSASSFISNLHVTIFCSSSLYWFHVTYKCRSSCN